MSDTPTITQQYSFAVGDDGDIEPSEESVETSLETFGASVDHRERDTRIAKPEATTFGVDDRKTVTRTDAGEQGALFANTDDDQQTLTGERAASQCLFGTDNTTNKDESDSATEGDEPTVTEADKASPRALADGGRVEDNNEESDGDSSDEDGNDDSNDTDPTFDADAEIVTNAWEGAYLSASWGYGQTNVELAQIVEVSDTGKTVLARKVAAERVDHARTSEQLRPTASQYGDEFRLHVRTVRDDSVFCSVRQRFRRRYLPGDQPGEMKLNQDDSAWQDRLTQRTVAKITRNSAFVSS